MTKEYHVFTNIQETHEQAFVFEVTRDEDFVELNELWMINLQGGREVKTRVNMGNIISSICQNIGGTVQDEHVPVILDIFNDILPQEKTIEVQMDLCQKEIEKSSNNSVDKLIKASEYAQVFHNENNGDVQKVIDSILQKKSNEGFN